VRGHVAKKGNNYYAVVYEGIDLATGKERHSWHAAGPRRIDAERLANELVRRRHNGEETTSDRSTLAIYLTERWLPLQRSRLRARTYESYRSVIELHVVPRIGRIKLGKLQPDDLDGLYVELLRDGNGRGKTPGGLSPTSVRYVHRVLRKALADAHRKGIVTRNVAALADPPKPSTGGEPTTIHVWDASELRRFLDATADHRLHALWTVAAKTGMRRGELMGLRWQDIDFDRSTITIRRALSVVGWELQFSDVKTRAGRRTIDIDRRILTMLLDRRDARAKAAAEDDQDFDPKGLVFARADGTPIHPEYITRTFNRLVAKHGLPRIRFHDIRHTHATLLLKAGVPPKVVAERLGHASPGFTLNVYQHILPGMQAEAAQIFDGLLSGPAEVNNDRSR
jgi:integrase